MGGKEISAPDSSDSLSYDLIKSEVDFRVFMWISQEGAGKCPDLMLYSDSSHSKYIYWV
jgi:hypothetical protein